MFKARIKRKTRKQSRKEKKLFEIVGRREEEGEGGRIAKKSAVLL